MAVHLCQHYLEFTGRAERGLWLIILSYVAILTKIRKMEIHVYGGNKQKYSVSKDYCSDFCTIS